MRATIPDEKERAARSRRAAKAITYGQSNLDELLTELHTIVAHDGQWQPTRIQGYQLKPVDMTAYKRSNVKGLKSKAYDTHISRAVPAVPFGIMGTTGRVGEQRVAILETVVCGNIHQNQPTDEMTAVYKQVAKRLKRTDIALFDAGFSLVNAVTHGVEQCVVRLARNCTFGRTPGKIPPRTSTKGPTPSRHQAPIVRPVARQHGDKLLAASEPDQTSTIIDEAGTEIEVAVWHKVYFLERHLERVDTPALKQKLRKMPLQVVVIHHPDFKAPWF